MYVNRQVNICVEVCRRQCVSVERWNWRLLREFGEEKGLDSLRKNGTFKQVVTGEQSTMSVAFSCDGEYMASGHISHQILVYHVTPCLHLHQILSGHHPRTPWCLTFDPLDCHTLYSGCLGGTVCKWDVQSGVCLMTWNPGILAPVNSITFPSPIPGYLLVAMEDRLYLLEAVTFSVKWHVSTGAHSIKVRLVLSHPEESKILTAITNPRDDETPFARSLRGATAYITYRLQLYRFGLEHSPDLEDASHGLVCLSARVFSPRSCIMTSSTVICSTINSTGLTHLCIYSISKSSFGQCLSTMGLQHSPVLSMDLSPHHTHLLLAITGKKSVYHMHVRYMTGPVAEVVRMSSSATRQTEAKLETHTQLACSHVAYCRATSPVSCNVVVWASPRVQGGVGVVMGTARGEVLFWGSPSATHGDRTLTELRVEWPDATDDLSSSCAL